MGMHAFTLTMLLSCLTLPAAPAEAVINPDLLRKRQDKAPEKLVIDVHHVAVEKDGRDRHVTAEATVKFVRESLSGLKKGQRITVQYTARRLHRKAVGPIPIPILSKGPTGAFLAKSKDGYRTAARHMSFVSPRKIRKYKVHEKARKRP